MSKPFRRRLRWGDQGWALGTARMAGLGREQAGPACGVGLGLVTGTSLQSTPLALQAALRQGWHQGKGSWGRAEVAHLGEA